MRVTGYFLAGLAGLAFVVSIPGFLFGGLAWLPILVTGVLLLVIVSGPLFLLLDVAIAIAPEDWVGPLYIVLLVTFYSFGLYAILNWPH